MDRRYWHLVVQMALKDFKIRYTHSALGYAWSVLNPLIFSLVYFLVFSVFIRFDVPFYAAYLLLGLVLWTFFAEGSGHGVVSLLARGNLVTKVAFPRQVIVYAAVLNALMTFAISLLVLALILTLSGMPVRASILAFPILLVDLIALTLGVALLLSPLHVQFHDVGYLWGITTQIGFWLTPVIYRENVVPEGWRWLLKYNPMARLIEHSRQVVILGQWPDWAAVGRTTMMVGLVLALGLVAFRRLQPRLVERY
jgi:ABC-type polysaccharide/polyol phosphate export permease